MKTKTMIRGALFLGALLILFGLADGRAVAVDGEEGSPPWGDCCDKAVCTRSYPPVCQCRDEVEACAPACDDCEEVSDNPYRYLCHDVWYGFPGPKCTATVDGDGANLPPAAGDN